MPGGEIGHRDRQPPQFIHLFSEALSLHSKTKTHTHAHKQFQQEDNGSNNSSSLRYDSTPISENGERFRTACSAGYFNLHPSRWPPANRHLQEVKVVQFMTCDDGLVISLWSRVGDKGGERGCFLFEGKRFKLWAKSFSFFWNVCFTQHICFLSVGVVDCLQFCCVSAPAGDLGVALQWRTCLSSCNQAAVYLRTLSHDSIYQRRSRTRKHVKRRNKSPRMRIHQCFYLQPPSITWLFRVIHPAARSLGDCG